MTQIIQHGTVVKNSPSITVYFSNPFPGTPTLEISPQWTGGVGYAETITDVSSNSFTLTSNNQASNYKVHWIGIYG
jgi:hypothetical protein